MSKFHSLGDHLGPLLLPLLHLDSVDAAASASALSAVVPCAATNSMDTCISS